MKESIKNFSEQFKFEPIIENKNKLKNFESVIIVGMGGSHLAAYLLKGIKRFHNIIIHKNYGLPDLMKRDLDKSLIIASSYSGNTEEVIDAYKIASSKKLNLAAISVGGTLLKLAKENHLPYIQLPDIGLQPRMALGFSLLALVKLIGGEKTLKELRGLSKSLKNCKEGEILGKNLAKSLVGKIPIIYASFQNEALVYNWKAKINETAKIPAFFNVFPELNHNEMIGYDILPSTKKLSEKFHFIFLKDSADDSRIIKRMDVCQKLFEDRGFRAEVLELKGKNVWQKIFANLLIADWAAYYLSEHYGVDPNQVPMVENFKKLIAS